VRFVLRHAPRRPRTLIFLGDDVTDESVFRHMRGVSVFVGSEGGTTAARYWLRSPVEVRAFLKRCVRLWEQPDRLRGKGAG
jgi:trehalose-phosphatase